MSVGSFVAATWIAGIIEGVSVFSHAGKKTDPQQSGPLLFIPAILYGTLSLPLSLIGAAPGISMITCLPFAPKMETLEHSDGAPTSDSINFPDRNTVLDSQVIDKGKLRVERLREENRIRHLGKAVHRAPTSPSAPISPPPATVTRFIATLDANAIVLPTPLAEAMRRTRFLFAGASLVAFVLSYHDKFEESVRKRKEDVLEKKRNGKDISAIQELTRKGKEGAVVRWCESLQQISRSQLSNVATIPLFICSTKSVERPQDVYWNPGITRDEWKTIPISSNWLLSAKSSRLLVLEVDLTPDSLEDYFQTSSRCNLAYAKAALVLDSLIATACSHGVVESKSQAVKVVLSSNQPSLPFSSSDIYVDVHHRLGVEVSSLLTQMHRKIEGVFVEPSDERGLSIDTTLDEEPSLSLPGTMKKLGKSSSPPVEKSTTNLQNAVNDFLVLADFIGWSIRRAADSSISFLTEVFGTNSRVVHVLSDEKDFVHFLQRSVRNWKIVWYDANDESDVQLFLKSGAAISVVCCGNDAFANALLAAIPATTLEHAQVLAILESPKESVPLGVSSLYISDVHNTLFSQIRGQLVEGKSPKEIQALVNLIH